MLVYRAEKHDASFRIRLLFSTVGAPPLKDSEDKGNVVNDPITPSDDSPLTCTDEDIAKATSGSDLPFTETFPKDSEATFCAASSKETQSKTEIAKGNPTIYIIFPLGDLCGQKIAWEAIQPIDELFYDLEID